MTSANISAVHANTLVQSEVSGSNDVLVSAVHGNTLVQTQIIGDNVVEVSAVLMNILVQTPTPVPFVPYAYTYIL